MKKDKTQILQFTCQHNITKYTLNELLLINWSESEFRIHGMVVTIISGVSRLVHHLD